MIPLPLSETAKKNIEAIAQVEHQLHARRSRVEKIGDWIARYFGSLWFIAADVVFFTLWIVLNVRVCPASGRSTPTRSRSSASSSASSSSS